MMPTFDAFGKTKVICTIGPSSQHPQVLVKLVNAGMDVARLNFSHGSRSDHKKIIETIRTVSVETGEFVTILQDLSGPKIRTGVLEEGKVELAEGMSFTFTTDDIIGDRTKVSTTYAQLPKDVKKGDVILVDDGRMSFRVEKTSGTDVACTVVDGGVLRNRKGMNLPGIDLSVPSLTEKDLEDLRFGLEEGVDYVALSFVRSGNDIKKLKDVIRESGKDVPVIAKIERAEAVAAFDEILAEADGVMVARGDLGVELPPENVPLIQKEIVRRCNDVGVPVIVATQMLESMIEHPRPTRAEANDVANAVLDGGDAVMLSGETSVGMYAVEAVHIMDRIIRRAETTHQKRHPATTVPVRVAERSFEAIARAACVLADEVEARAIIALTHSGATARVLARYRPSTPIVAATEDERVVRRLNLVWSVRGMLFPHLTGGDSDTVFKALMEELKKNGFVEKGDRLVFTAGIPFMQRGTTNSVKIETVT
jgi:pyruvate kinase